MADVAVLIPCYNEEATVGRVVDDFRAALPGAAVYVCDNNSSDRTADIAAAHGAVVLTEKKQGKGFAVRRLFSVVEADAYLMVDGDCTYPAETAGVLLAPILSGEADLVVGDRLAGGVYARENKRPFHNLGNKLVRWLVNRLYKARLRDIMSGYRAMSRLFVKTMPVMSPGFELETEMSLHALECRMDVLELPVEYRDRPAGSVSKLNTVRDGARVLRTIVTVFKDYKPLVFFSLVSLLFLLAGFLTGIPVIVEYVRTAFVARVPTAILAVGLVIIALLSLSCGLILDTIGRHTRRQYELLHRLIDKKSRADAQEG